MPGEMPGDSEGAADLSVPWNAPIVHSMSEGKFTVKYLRSRGSPHRTRRRAPGGGGTGSGTQLAARGATHRGLEAKHATE